jgi:hypothetical protein
MDYHQNARLTVHSRELLAKLVVEQGCTNQSAALCFHVTAKTAPNGCAAIASRVCAVSPLMPVITGWIRRFISTPQTKTCRWGPRSRNDKNAARVGRP